VADPKDVSKSEDKNPSLVVFGRMRGSHIDQVGVFASKDADAARKAAKDAGLKIVEVSTEAEKKIAAALPQGVINAQGRFSLSPALPQVLKDLESLVQAAEVSGASIKVENASAAISARLWRQIKPGTLVLAAGYDEHDNLLGWYPARVIKVDDGELLVRWRDFPEEPVASRSLEYVALLHPELTEG
jgi:hypothetical protein